jgi:hypothetical protein
MAFAVKLLYGRRDGDFKGAAAPLGEGVAEDRRMIGRKSGQSDKGWSEGETSPFRRLIILWGPQLSHS